MQQSDRIIINVLIVLNPVMLPLLTYLISFGGRVQVISAILCALIIGLSLSQLLGLLKRMEDGD